MENIDENRLIIYQTDSGQVKVEVNLQGENVWLSLNQIASLFQKDKTVISRHLKNIYLSNELDYDSTVKKISIMQVEGQRKVKREVEYYNLDTILSVGYRVNSKRSIEFRRWATKILKEYLLQGYAINHEKIVQDKLIQLQQTVNLLSHTLINQDLVNNTGKNLLQLIQKYTKTWNILTKYDKNSLDVPQNLSEAPLQLISHKEAVKAITALKSSLKEEAGDLFGLDTNQSLISILANIDQTFEGKQLYPTIESKAAHLLYFIIKDHPFSDGNKRIGCLLFLLYLNKTKVNYKVIDANGMASLALLVAESNKNQKDIIIKLIINLIHD